MKFYRKIIAALIGHVISAAAWVKTRVSFRSDISSVLKSFYPFSKDFSVAIPKLFFGAFNPINGLHSGLLSETPGFSKNKSHPSLFFCKSKGASTLIHSLKPGVFSPPYLPKPTNTGSSALVWRFALFLSRLIRKPSFFIGVWLLLAFAGNVNAITSTGTGGNWSSASTWVGGVVPVSGADVTIVAGATVTIDSDLTVGSLTISGILQYEAFTARILNAKDFVKINSGGVFRSAQSGNVKDHQLIVEGSIENNGTIDFSSNSNLTGALIKFAGSSTATFNCNNALLTNLQSENGVVIEKGKTSTWITFAPGGTFKVLSDGTIGAKGFLSITSGTFKIIGTNSFANPVFSLPDYKIPSTGGFELSNSNATVPAQNGSVDNQGFIRIAAGTYHIGTAPGNSVLSHNNGTFELDGGTVNIAGSFALSSATGILSGGTLNLSILGNGTSGEASFECNPTSILHITGTPLITFAIPNSSAFSDADILTGAGTKSITGGTFQMGTAATPAVSTFFVNSDISLNKITVFNECTIRVIHTSKDQFKNAVNGTTAKAVLDSVAMALIPPESITVSCNGAIPATCSTLQEFINAGGKALNNCTLLPASFKLIGQMQSGTSCPYTITRTYQVSDIFGSTGTAKQLILVEDEAVEPQPEAVVEPAKEEVLTLKSAKTVYTATQNGNWNDPATWGNTGPPTALDNVIIPNGITVTVNALSACANIDIQAGGIVQSGGAYTLQVNGDWSNNGTYNGGTNGIVDFTGASNAIISGTTNFEELVVNKGSLSTTLTINGTATVLSSGGLTLTSGLVQINSGNSFAINPSSALIIPNIAGFFVNGGTLSTGNFSITNEGLIRISSGTANFGNSSGNSVHTQTDGVFEVSGTSVVNIAGRLENTAGGTLAPLGIPSGINISGGTVTLATQGNGLDNVGSLNVTTSGAFNFTSGTIVFQRESTAGSAIDLGLVSGSGSGAKTTIGGTFQFGNASTPAGTVFNISSSVPLNNVTSFPNADLKLINDVIISQWTLNPSTTIDLNGKKLQYAVANTGTTYNFPLDNGSGTSIPVSVNLTSAGTFTSAFIQIETTGSKLPENKSATNYLNRYWTVTTSGITSPVYDVTATYADADIAGTETKIAMGSWTGALPWIKGNVVNDIANTVSKTGITSTNFVFAGITNDPPTVTISATSSSICLGASTTLTANPLGDPTFTYSWSSVPAGFTSTSPTPSVNPVSTSDYTVIVTDANGFTASASITVTVNPLLPASISITASTATTICAGTSVTFTATPTNGGAAPSYQWKVGATNVGTNSPNYTDAALTNGASVTCVMTSNATPCLTGSPATSNTVTMTVNPNLPVSVSIAASSNPICSGTSVTFTATPTNGGTTPAYQWKKNGTNVGANSTTYTDAGLASGDLITCELTSNATCATGSPATSNTVTMTVNSAPVFISCPSNFSLNTSAGACTAVGSYTATALGQPAPTYTYSFTTATTGSGAGTGTGSTFNSGITNVKVTATNTCASVDCNFTVTVTDNVLPVISGCPTNITVYTGVGHTSCDQAATWTAPTATDNCTATGSLIWTLSQASGSIFPVGTTTVTYTVKDASNNSTTCTFTVTIVDNTPPTFTTPGAITVYTNASCLADTTSAITGAPTSLFDNCTTTGSLIVSHTNGVKTLGACAGSYSFTRTWKVRDAAGNPLTETQLISVADNTKPIFSTFPPDIAVSCDQGILPAVTGTPIVTDNCGGATTLTLSDVTAAGSCPGNYVVTRTWTAKDCSNNISTRIQLITVSDDKKPTATIPNITATCPSTIPLAYANYAEFIAAGGTASDNCGGTLTVALNDEIANGLIGKPGYCPTSITRIYRVTDQCGNYFDVTQTIAIAGDCGCSPCTDGTHFHLVDFLGNPTGTTTIVDNRSGKCCTAGKSDDCISFNIRIDPDAVGIEILIGGAAPKSSEWSTDCNAISITNSTVCIPGGSFHLFTFCKPGNNSETYTFRSIPGVITGGDVNARVDCSGQLGVSGIISNPVWNSISPGALGDYNSYLSSTSIVNPTFTAPVGAPSVIVYQVCGNIGTTICNSLGTDCANVTVYVKDKIALQWNTNPGVVCPSNIPTLVANISPAGATYTYQWYSGYGATGTLLYSGSNSYKPLAAGPYSLKVTDTQNGVQCSFQIFDFDVIFDTTGASVFTPPAGNLTIECNDPNATQLIQNWITSATALDENGNALPVTNNYSGITQACGTDLPVTFSASDHCGNVGTATAHILIIDTQAPTWSTAAGSLDRTVSCSDASGLNTAQALVPVANDLCDPATILTKVSGSFVASSCPNAGTYTNTWTAKDACNNVSTGYTQTITVTDTTPPVVAGSLNTTTVQGCSAAAAPIAVSTVATLEALPGGITINDACTAKASLTVSSVDVSSGSCLIVISRTYTIKDACNNSITVVQTINVSDTQAPTFTSCPPAITATTALNECYTIGVVLGTATATDNCSVPVITNNAPAQFPLGNTTVTWTATDVCGNSSTCTQIVTITDNNQAPTITCPGPVVQTAGANNCFLNNVVIPDPVTADNCGVVKLTWTILNPDGTTSVSSATGINTVGGRTFNVGVSTVTYTAFDAAGNPSLPCSFTVWIKDLNPPVFIIGCPADITLPAVSGICTAVVTIPVPAVSDPCGELVSIVNSFNGTSNASGTYPSGTTNVIWTITDTSGNVTTCTQKVTVTDTQLPTISCPGNVTQTALLGNCQLNNVVIPDPVTADNCGVTKLTWTILNPDGTTSLSPATGINTVGGLTFNVGVSTVTYTAFDAAGNPSLPCSFTVWIKDLNPPVFTVGCPSDITLPAASGICTAIVTIPVSAVSDPCGELVSIVNSFNGTSNASGTYPSGTTNVIWTITDTSGNVTTCTQKVTVTDTQLPTITCPGPIVQTAGAGNCFLDNVVIPDPVTADNCGVVKLTWTILNPDGTTSVSPATGINTVGGLTFKVGVSTVTYTAFDAAGNPSLPCSFTVTIKSLNPLVFTAGCPLDVTQPADAGQCNAAVTVPVPAVTDPCSEGFTVVNSFNSTNNASGTYPIGTTNVVWTITDASGNVTTCTQHITVTDLLPTLSCPSVPPVQADLNQSYASNVTVPAPAYGDNCPGLTLTWAMTGATTGNSLATGENILPSPNTFNVGVTTITYTLTDANAHTLSCPFTITVESKPVITCPANIPRNTDVGLCSAAITIIPATATGSGVTITGVRSDSKPLSDPYPVGITTITWTATNVSGTDVCTQTITVTDNEAPTFNLKGPFSFCVMNIQSAIYDGQPEPNADIIPVGWNPGDPRRPDWYIVNAGSTELDITNLHDNCCDPADLTISWRIDFDPATPGSPTSISGTGQPSTYGSDIKLWGDGVNFLNLTHTIKYTVTDCNSINNKTEKTQTITVNPRPNVVKVP